MFKFIAISAVFGLTIGCAATQATDPKEFKSLPISQSAGTAPIALTFGRCIRSQMPAGCPSPTNKDADGDTEFQKLMISCLATNTGHEFVAIGDDEIPKGLWLDLSIQPARFPSDQGKIEFTGTLHQDKSTYIDGRLYSFTPTPETYRRVCGMYSDDLKKAIASLN